MNLIATFHDLAVRFSLLPGWAILLAKASAILGIAWLMHFALARQNPRWRRFLWRGTVVGMAILAFWATGLPSFVVHLQSNQPQATLSPSFSPTQPINSPRKSGTLSPALESPRIAHEGVEMERADWQNARSNVPPPSEPEKSSVFAAIAWQKWLTVAWILVTAILFLRLVIAYLALKRELKHARPASEPVVQEVVRICAAFGCRKQIKILTSKRFAVPFLCGIWKPIIVLPEKLCEKEFLPQLPGVLAHELAHVRSGDIAWTLLLSLHSMVFWFHPLAWRIGAAHRAACDAVCDAVSASYLGDVAAYRRTLAGVALKASTPLAAVGLAMARTCDVRRRLAALERKVFSASLRRRTVTCAAIVGLMALGLLAGLRLALAAPSPHPTITDPPKSAHPAENKIAADGTVETPSTANELTYHCKVTDAVTKQPIQGAAVTVLRRAWNRSVPFSQWKKWGETKHQTDAEGRYEFTLPSEQAADTSLYIEITATHADYVRYYGGYSFDMIRKNETLGERPFYEKVELFPAAKISGVVVTPEGVPAVEVAIKTFSMAGDQDLNHSAWSDLKTDKEGKFEAKVYKNGDAIFWIIPQEYAPSTHAIHTQRGDLGRFTLDKGLVLKGRVVDADGKSLPNYWVNADIRSGAAKQKIPQGVFDYLARSSLCDEKGEFAMAPLPEGVYALQVTDAPRGGSAEGKGAASLPAVFLGKQITLDEKAASKPIEIRAVPHVVVSGRFYDSSGKPIKGYAPHLASRTGNSERWYFTEMPVDGEGKFTAIAPKWLKASLSLIDNEHHVLRTRVTKDGPLVSGREVDLGVIDKDTNEIEVIRYAAPTLLVKAMDEKGQAIKGFRARIKYLASPLSSRGEYLDQGKAAGHVRFERQDDGRWRSTQLNSDEEFDLTVEADGYQPDSQKLKLPEAEVKELNVVLQAGSKPEAEKSKVKKNRLVIHATNKETGAPLADVKIHFSGQFRKAWFEKDVPTDKDGIASVEWEAEANSGRLFASCRKEEFAPIDCLWGEGQGEVPIPEQVDLKFQPGKLISGLVQDPEGHPIEGAKVKIEKIVDLPKPAYYWSIAAELKTDAKGSWQWNGSPSDLGTYGLLVEHPDYVKEGSMSQLTGSQTVSVLKRGRNVTGRVLTIEGTPIESAKVLLGYHHNVSGAPKVATDSDGRFEFKNCTLGESLLTVEADGFSPDQRDIVVGKQEDAGEFRLAKGHTLRVRIVDGKGNPMRAIFEVASWRNHESLSFSAHSDESGRVLWTDAPEDTVLCTIRAAGCLDVRDQPFQASDKEQVVTLSPELIIRGSVTDAKTGQPIPSFVLRQGVDLKSRDKTHWYPREGFNYRDGSYEFKSSQQFEGTHRLRIEAPGYYAKISRPFKPDEGSVKFDFALEPGTEMVGTVLNAEGQPVADASVALAHEGSPAFLNDGQFDRHQFQADAGTTDAAGKFTFPPQSDEPYLLIVTHDSGFAETSSEEFKKSPEIRLKHWGRISGQVLRGDKPEASRNVSYALQLESDQRTFLAGCNYSAKTDAQGRFELNRVVPGPGTISRGYIIEFAQSSYQMSGWQQSIDVKPGETATVTIGGTGRTLVGRVELDRKPDTTIDWTASNPVTIQRWDTASNKADKQAFSCYGKFDETGRFEIPDVPPGNYRLICHVDGTSSRNKSLSPSVIGNAEHDFKVEPFAEAERNNPLDLGAIKAKAKAVTH